MSKFDPSKIKWDEAPEGYDYWLQDLKSELGEDCSDWYKKGDRGYVLPGGQAWSYAYEGIQYTVHTRPANLPVAWDGTGNPPVGANVYTTHEGEEAQVVILGYAKHTGSRKDVVTYEDAKTGELSAFIAGKCEFSIESAATKAERDQLINDICSLGNHTAAAGRTLAEHLHKLGYRKP